MSSRSTGNRKIATSFVVALAALALVVAMIAVGVASVFRGILIASTIAVVALAILLGVRQNGVPNYALPAGSGDKTSNLPFAKDLVHELRTKLGLIVLQLEGIPDVRARAAIQDVKDVAARIDDLVKSVDTADRSEL